MLYEVITVLHAHRLRLGLAGAAAVLGHLDDLGDGEHADHYREHGEAAVEFGEVEGEAADP